MNPAEKLINYFSNVSNTAKNLRATALLLYGDKAQQFDRQSVYNWRIRKFIPTQHGDLIEAATKGAVTKKEILEATPRRKTRRMKPYTKKWEELALKLLKQEACNFYNQIKPCDNCGAPVIGNSCWRCKLAKSD